LGKDIVGSGHGVGASLELLRKTYFQSRIRIHDPPNPKQEVSTEILKGRSLHLWRVCHVFAMSLLFVAECMQVLIEVSSRISEGKSSIA
jgi:hypothetical protein